MVAVGVDQGAGGGIGVEVDEDGGVALGSYLLPLSRVGAVARSVESPGATHTGLSFSAKFDEPGP